ncbi:ADP-heptose:LPS heptosyltransferase [Pedobacter sp. W3I1]|uniref:glycosyltransferase family 9 protein n=1 Tax=Pedobacter sp. W3I1 TaxID=3042291 RepID=UPI0027835C23|nr:glycosyltransferase family 9 protein [Pedobacter sp. W3I1]MDQ0637844.1 ADP-heptose:LPS heptosyltransferase [Pedobacter sp. W3I1]
MGYAIRQFKKIAIFRALQLGDLLCAMPALKNLRLACPDAEIVFIGLPSSQKLIERYAALFDRFMEFPGFPGLPEREFDEDGFVRFERQMRLEAFDIILQMHGNGSIVNAMLGKLSGSLLGGFSLDRTELEGNPLLMPYPDSGHESLRHIALMKHLGVPIETTEMFFPLHENDFKALDRSAIHKKYICMHCGSRGAWRQWPPVNFAKMADYCIEQDYEVVLTGSADELGLIDQVSALMKGSPVVVAGKTDLGTLGVLLKGAKGLIANCTGVSHMAAALKVHSVIISMDGEPGRWGPLDVSRHTTIDWTKTPEYNLVKQAVNEMLFR